jgi:hypothetical protein
MFTRAARAALFDRKAFTEAFFDDDAMADGAIVVAVVGALTYLGALSWLGALGAFDLAALFQVLIASVASWLILGFATWFAASRLFKSSNRPQTLVAMHGLAPLPLLLEIFGSPLAWVGLVWYLGILVLATKEATELPYKFAGVSVLIGFAAAVLVRALLRVPFALFSGGLG